MFCEKCGKPIPDSQRLCDSCNPAPKEPVLAVPTFQRAPMDISGPAKKPTAVPSQEPLYQPPVQTPAYEAPAFQPPVQAPAYEAPAYEPPKQAPAYEAPAYEPPKQAPAYEAPAYEPPKQAPAYEPPKQAPAAQPAFVLNTPAEGAKPKRKPKKGGKGGKIALIAIALLLVVGIVLAAINWGSIVRFFQRNLGDPAEYLQDVEKENVAAVASDVAAAYDSALALCASDGAAVDAVITLEMSDTLRSLLQTALSQNDVNMDLSWVENIVLTPQMDIYEDTLRVDVGVGLNGITVATLSAIWDTADQMIYVGIPELHSTYVAIDAAELLGDEVDSVAEALVMSRTLMAAFVDAMPEGAQIEELINRYMGVILEGMTEAEKETRTVKVGSVKQSLLVVSVELSQEDILNIAIDLLETAQDDALIEEILDDFDGAVATMAGQPMGLYAAFTEAVDMTLEELDYLVDEAETATFLTIDSYIDSDNVIVGRTFTLEYEDEELVAQYITVTEGGKWEFEAEMDMVTISGSGTIKNDVRNGSYTLCVDGVDYITLELEDCVCTDEEFTGTFYLIPESAIYDMMDVDSSVSGMLGNMALKLVVEADALTIGIDAAGAPLFALVVSGEVSEAQQIAIPESVSTEDDAGGMKWLAELKFDAVLDNLERAGVPSQYMDMAKQVVEMFRAEFG